MEDFNTCTLPHEKFIDLEKWEMAEYNREYCCAAVRSSMAAAPCEALSPRALTWER